MKTNEIKSHKVGTKAHQKELFRLFGEFDSSARKLAKNKGTVEDFEWILEIASSEYASPMQELFIGKCYLNAWCVSFDMEKAHEWFQKAKKHGNELVCLQLSFIYASLEEPDESISCLRRAKWHGSKIAKGMLEEMEKHPFKYPEA